MEYKANSGIWGTMFGVPCVVADNFLKLATGQQLKVLLYLLRCSGRHCSDEEISLNTGVSQQEAADAVLFWQQVNVLTPQRTTAEKVPELSMAAPVSKPAETVPEHSAPKPELPKRQDLPPSEIADVMKNSSDISELFKVAESALGKLSHTQQNSLIWMMNYLGLKAEVILVLLVYCEEIEKTNVAYIEKIAVSWAEKGINTFDVAQEEVERLKSSNDYIGVIMKMFEMKRRPTTKQLEIIEKWRSTGYARDLIHYAYEKTIENTGKLSFEYVDKVLTSWNDSGFCSSDDVKRAESDYRKRKKSGSDTTGTFDADKYSFLINNF